MKKAEDLPLFSATIRCPYCKYEIAVFHILNESSRYGSWNVSNFGRHLKKVHLKKGETKLEETFEPLKDMVDNSDLQSKLKVGSIINLENVVVVPTPPYMDHVENEMVEASMQGNKIENTEIDATLNKIKREDFDQGNFVK